MHIVDAQIHLWTNNQAPPHHRQEPLRSDEALRMMDAAAVDKAINCPAIWDPDSNAYAVEVARLHPDRFATLGWFNLHREPDPQFLDAFVAQPGMLGLRFIIWTKEQQEAFTAGKLDWIWESADRLAIPVGFMLPPNLYERLASVAARYTRMRVLIDHLGVGPMFKIPEATAHLDRLLRLAVLPNVAVKATGVPSMAADGYPFASTHSVLQRVYEAFGPQRVFWGTDITRLTASWRECIRLFTEELPWLKGDDLELVMGRAVLDWVGWS
jgi:predicted TIM-barrel fold metal-dependent hydrolase